MDRRHFFVSRAGGDAEFAAFLCKQLSAAGYSYYEQMQWAEGDNFIVKMNEALETSEFTIALYSPQFFEKLFTKAEWSAAFAQQRLIGTLIVPCKIPAVLGPFSYIDLTKAQSREEKVEVFLSALAKRTYELPLHDGGWRPPLTSKARTPPKTLEVLPYLCDREELEPVIVAELRAADDRAVVFVVGAEDEHRPEKLRERLANVTIPLHLAGKDPYVRPPKFVAWPAVQTVAELRQQLELAKSQHSLNGHAPEDVIVVVTDVIIEKSSEKTMPALLREYIRFWRESSVGKGCLFVVCLSISFRSKSFMRFLKLGKARVVAREEVEKLQHEEAVIGCKVLHPLKAVPRQQVHNWTQLPVVQAKAAIDTEDLEDLYDKRGVTEIPMRELAPKLRDLLERKGI